MFQDKDKVSWQDGARAFPAPALADRIGWQWDNSPRVTRWSSSPLVSKQLKAGERRNESKLFALPGRNEHPQILQVWDSQRAGALVYCFHGLGEGKASLGSRSGDFGLSEPLATIGKPVQLQDNSSCTDSVTRLLITARHMLDSERALGFPDATFQLVSPLILNVTPVQEAGCAFPLS